jgi:hypothetical protein
VSKFIRHTSCPKCGSKDNLAEYDDHVWCFGCRYHKLKDDIESIRTRYYSKEVPQPLDSSISIATTDVIPLKALSWLLRYGMTMEEIRSNNIGWNEDQQLLVLMNIHNYWQARCFGNQKVKYLSKGNKPLTIYGDGDTIVCTEDIVSAIKIARLSPDFCAIPLLGCSMPENFIEALRKRWKNIVIWLDRDKAKDAINIARNLKQRGFNASVVISPEDPKVYSKGELSEWLRKT